jgi:hypothetical protein
VLENRVLRKIFGLKGEKVTGEWRKLHNEELNDLYPSHNIVRVIKSRIRWAGHAARMGEAYIGFWWGNLMERDNLGDPGVDGISVSGMWGYGLDRADSGQRQVADTSDCGNEPSGPIKCGELLD